jgi:hypothetical protein
VEFTLNGAVVATETCVPRSGGVSGFRQPAALGVATASIVAPTQPGIYEIVARGLTSGVFEVTTITVSETAEVQSTPETAEAQSIPETR